MASTHIGGQLTAEQAETGATNPIPVSPKVEESSTLAPTSEESSAPAVPVEPPETAPETEEITAPEAPEAAVEGEAPEGEAPPEQPAEEKPPTPVVAVTDAQLKDMFQHYPELKQVFQEHPHLRGVFFQAVELRKVYPTLQDAQRAKEWALQLAAFDRLYYSPRPEDKRAFLERLYKDSLDENGQPTGHYEQIAEIVTHDSLSHLYRAVSADPSWAAAVGLTQQQAVAAVAWVGRMLNAKLIGTPGVGGTERAPETDGKPAPAAVPQELKDWYRDVQRREADITRREMTLRGDTETAFADQLNRKFTDDLATSIEKSLSGVTGLKKLSPFFQESLREGIKTRIIKALEGDEFFAAQTEALVRSGNRSPEHFAQVIAELESRVRQVLPDTVRQALREAGIAIMAAQAAKNERDTQAGARREPTGVSSPGRVQRPAKPAVKTTGDYNKDADRILGLDTL